MKRILRARFFGRLLFLGSAVFYGTFALAVSAPTGCTDISKIPVTNEIDFGAGIEAIFIQFSTNPAAGCASCHTSDAGPSGGLNLDPNDQNPDATSPYTGIVNVPSLEAPAYNYVTPNRPELSYLFMKINCDTPPSGSRMPLGYTDVFTPEQQAFIYDWIAGGATIETTSTIFRGTFDIRGLFIDAVFSNGFESH